LSSVSIISPQDRNVKRKAFVASDATAVTIHMLAALMGKSFEPNALTGVLGALHDDV